ncbi:hypothetical protein [Paenibacillus sp. Soil724D2]|uniref:hypothetical protein n=1 Tax=Paenibacillus sp. (strain Soil724D2) TaxID=1736392 RepID=UPI000AFAE0C5|nr:hypothetical protein [Paenibacillus sp. Soil724D2]
MESVPYLMPALLRNRSPGVDPWSANDPNGVYRCEALFYRTASKILNFHMIFR